ncbi:MAG: DUF2231 domain-containing protein [Candidatus Zixiibacteriota bacterium]
MRLSDSSLPLGVETAHFSSRLFHQAKALVLASTFAVLLAIDIGAAPVNALCPVTTDEPVDSTITVTYEGQEIAFCCQKCRRQFLADPQKFVSNLATLANGHKAHDHTNEHGPMATDSLQPDSITASETGHSESGSMAGHNHATDHDRSSNRMITYLGKFHPVVVHFPIALIIAALFMSLPSVVGRSTILDLVSTKMTYLGAASSLLAVLLGLAAGSDARYPALLTAYFSWHRILGISSAMLSCLTAYSAYRFERKGTPLTGWLFRGLLALNSLFIGITAHLGATLVYGPDHFSF